VDPQVSAGRIENRSFFVPNLCGLTALTIIRSGTFGECGNAEFGIGAMSQEISSRLVSIAQTNLPVAHV
jgi:hypothetical protein